jgi:hypothetical protein
MAANTRKASLTARQLEILTFLDDKILTAPELVSAFNELHDSTDPVAWPRASYESVYISLVILHSRGLVMRNDTWPIEWSATEEGQRALDTVENHPELRPRKVR